jgi:hypothetical protein
MKIPKGGRILNDSNTASLPFRNYHNHYHFRKVLFGVILVIAAVDAVALGMTDSETLSDH